MSFFGLSFPMGRFFGIEVRLHFTFFLYAFAMLRGYGEHMLVGALVIFGLYLSVLLHEFGHALAARWCDGDADQIVLWPLGGLAMVRPLFNPTAHLITSAAGPFVSLLLWAIFFVANHLAHGWLATWPMVALLVREMADINAMLLLFNLIPAFPMDGGRILRDVLWHWVGVGRSAQVAVWLSRVIAGLGLVGGIFTQNYQLAMLAGFVLFLSSAEQATLAWNGPVQPFSILERWKRGSRRRSFQQSTGFIPDERSATPFHGCVRCGRTELDAPDVVFRVSSDGHEYCAEHLPRR